MSTLRTALAERVVVADGAIGTMLQASDVGVDDFAGHEGCNEILNVTRPDIVTAIHEAYLDAGADCVTTNSFGANLANLGEYGISDRIAELSQASARLARAAADRWATPERPRWVEALLRGGADALIIETCQDLLQAKAAVIGSRRAAAAAAPGALLIVQVTIETTGAMLLGSEIAAALTALEPLGINMIGLNCATGPGEMSEHLRYLAAHARVLLSCEPNAGLPVLTRDGASYPLTPVQLADAHDRFTREFGLSLVGGCCGTTPEHIAVLADRVAGRPVARRRPRPEPGVASLYQHVPFRQDTAFLSIGERTNANGSKAFRDAMLEARFEDCVQIARAQTRDGAHLLDVCVDYVGRDGVADMREIAGRLATAATLPLVLDSTEPDVIEAGLELTGGRSVINSVNYEDGDGPDSRIARVMPMVREHGAAVIALTIDERGQARTAAWKVEVAERLIADLAAVFDGEVRYARDAFEGLRLMNAAMAVRRGVPGAIMPELRTRRVRVKAAPGGGGTDSPDSKDTARSDVATNVPVPEPPFLGTEVIKGIPLADYATYLDERALFMGQWGLKPGRGGGASYEELVETQGRPRLRMWLERMQTEGLLEAAVVSGYFRCVSSGNDLIVLDSGGMTECERFSFPRQRRDRRLCLADFFRPREQNQADVVAFQLATMGTRVSVATAELFAKNAYREYLELHGLSVQLTEALAEYWHARIRRELGLDGSDPADLGGFFRVEYRGARYSFGYPACLDLADRAKVVRLLEPSRIGVELSQEMQLHPEQSTDAIVLHHPEAKYFSV